MRFRVLAGVLTVAALVAAAGCSATPAATPSAPGASAPGLAGDGNDGGALAGDGNDGPAAGGLSSGAVSEPAPATQPAPTTQTVSLAPSTVVVTPTDPTVVPPPPTTAEPAATAATCPYLTIGEVEDANGQHVGKTATIAVKPYPICVFYRPDGTVMAVTRVIEAASPAAATAAVNQHVPIDKSFPVTHPTGWSGGAMATPDGVPGYPDAGSIYAVSKGDVAVVAISNQDQSIKGRQMASDVIANLKL